MTAIAPDQPAITQTHADVTRDVVATLATPSRGYYLALFTAVGMFLVGLEEVGDLADLVMFGDDLGTQQGPVMSPALYRRLIKPAHTRMVQAVKKFDKPVLLHSCGSVAAFIPDLIEIGIDAIHPVQVTAKGMDTAQLKKEYGRDITFWGGIDTHRVLPRGTPGDVREEVRKRIADLAPGGGYVLGAVHNIQAEVPVENVLAMLDAAREFGRY